MTAVALSGVPPRNVPRSILAVFGGFVVVFVLSLGVDQILHVLGVYPPWGQPMRETSHNLLALSYRLVFNIFGCYLIARWAPRHPLKHAMIGGAIGLVLSSLGAAGAIAADMGPAWYPILLALSSVPCAWVGGKLYRP
jgi:hypothetical protein